MLAVVSDDADEVHRSPAELAILAAPDLVCAAVAARVPQRPRSGQPLFQRPEASRDAPLRAGHVLQALGDRLPADAVVVEECPSNRDELMLRVPARQPLGMVSPAMGGLGWGLPGPSACGWACRTAPSSQCSATARRSSGSRASGAPRATASARSSSCSRTGATG